MTIYSVNDQSLYVHEVGRASRPLALLIHGWSSSWFAMSPLLPYLSKRHRCLAVDLPGYGQSPRGPERATIPGYADTLADLIRQLSDRPVVLVGHSMGGMICLTLALRHPELVERLVLLCPTISGQLSLFINLFIAPVTILERFLLADLLVSLVEPYTVGVTDRLMRPASFAEHSGASEKDYYRLRADARRPGQGRIRFECFRAMRQNDLRGKLSQIEVPALVIWGMEDNTVPLKDASALVEEWPDADLRIIPQASHWPHFETPQVTQRYIEGFLGRPLKLFNLHTQLLSHV
jgi:pimeloyl-ACP methyl ester carboxylesterase